jgi:hypothetical protein
LSSLTDWPRNLYLEVHSLSPYVHLADFSDGRLE